MRIGPACFLLPLILLVPQLAFATDALEYNRDIRPILADKCFSCHGADSAARKADLRLDQRELALDAGAITPGAADESLLIERIFSEDADEVMPPAETKQSLSADQKDKLKRWIESGAEYQPHWSLLVPQKTAPPAVQDEDWVKNPLDRFVLSSLEKKGLQPAPVADGETLFRRLHLDITGLPPSPADTKKFVADYARNQDTAVSAWIDRLMAQPTWGEHRARYWLDAARYGDTHGMHFDNYREMWPYRDWVIRALNANQPFDQFTLEQIAGDLFPDPSEDQLIATGFQRCNITTNEGGTIDEENLAIYAADRVQTLGWIYLGLTTNCCQCHDHKFDPLTMKDYYALAAFFRNTTQQAKDGNMKDGRGPVLTLPSEEDRPRWNALPDEISTARQKREDRKENAHSEYETWLVSASVDSLNEGLLAEGLALHLPLTEGGGKTIRGATSDGKPYEAEGEVEWIADGKLGPAPNIQPGATFNLGQEGDFEIDHPFSFGGWVKATHKDASGAILARINQEGSYRGWDLWQDNNTFAVHLIDAWPKRAIKTRTHKGRLKPGQWQHVLVTYDGSAKAAGIKIYLDGVEQPQVVEKDSLSEKASIRTEVPLRLGQRSQSQVFSGAVQDIRVYDHPLSKEAVKSLLEIPAIHKLLRSEEKRSAEEQQAIYTHYLQTQDPEFPQLAKRVADLEAERGAIRGRSPMTHIQRERNDSPAMAHILMRGEYDKKGESVEAATPAALHPMGENAPRNRLGLAQWIIDPANPLTTRVTVNRFWQEIFGRGLVPTPEDLGVMGALPSHEELLNWLAVDFRENGWDVKRLFKQMLSSATYRQAAVTTPEKIEKDRDNTLLSRGPRFRMDAEMVRDYALAAGGLLSPKMYGPSVKPYQPINIWDIVGLPGGNTRDYEQDAGENLVRRTVYSFWKRMAPPPNLEAFNAPSREVCTVRRERTNTPLQALVTLNDPLFVETARHLAQLALNQSAGSDESTMDYIANYVLCRSLQPRERSILQTSKNDLRAYYQSHPEDAKALIAVGEIKADEQLDPADFAAWTMVCNQLMNLDETLNK
jgi:hypothetical protein